MHYYVEYSPPPKKLSVKWAPPPKTAHYSGINHQNRRINAARQRRMISSLNKWGGLRPSPPSYKPKRGGSR